MEISKDHDCLYFVRINVWKEKENTQIRALVLLGKTSLRYCRPSSEMPFSSKVVGHLTEAIGKVINFPYYILADEDFLFFFDMGHVAYSCWL